jgi:hypothetical protein
MGIFNGRTCFVYKNITLAAAIGVALSFGSAHASSWPASVVGIWDTFADQNSPVLTITNQGTSGKCRSISGTMVDPASGANDVIAGFYCPSSGRISFLRTGANNGQAYQAYIGNLSDTPTTGNTRRMGGTFMEETGSPTSLGEYEWFAELSR